MNQEIKANWVSRTVGSEGYGNDICRAFRTCTGQKGFISPARNEQHWCLPTLLLNGSLWTLSLREMRMKRDTDQYPYLVSFLRLSGAIAPSPPPAYFCRGSRFAFPGGDRCDQSAIKQGYENVPTKACLSRHD